MSLTPAPGSETAAKAVFWQKETDEREDGHAAAAVHKSPQIADFRASLRVALKQWDPRAKNGHGAWATEASRIDVVPHRSRHIEPNPLGLDQTMDRAGRIVNLPEFEDSPAYVQEEALQYVHCSKGAADLREICADRTGLIIPPDRYEKLLKARAEIQRQSTLVAEKLERTGVGGYKTGDEGEWHFDPLHFAAYGDQGENAVQQIRYRRCNFIPAVAQQKRAHMLKHLELWLHNNPHARFWTFTSGKRCPIPELRKRLQELHRKISKLNAQQFMSEAGLQIIFRASETGSLTDDQGNEIKDAAGNWLFHPHAHCIVEQKRRLTPEHWSQLLGDVKSYWKTHWDDAGQIQNVREVCKYPIKPADVLRLTDSETAELYHALFRLHQVQPLGALKEQIADIKSDNDALIYRGGGDDGCKIVRVKNWNSKPPTEKRSEADKQVEKILRSKGDSPEDEQTVTAQAVAILAPGPFFGSTIRPAILVRGRSFMQEDKRRICEIPKIKAMIAACMPQFLAAENENRRREQQSEISSVLTIPLCKKTTL